MAWLWLWLWLAVAVVAVGWLAGWLAGRGKRQRLFIIICYFLFFIFLVFIFLGSLGSVWGALGERLGLGAWGVVLERGGLAEDSDWWGFVYCDEVRCDEMMRTILYYIHDS